MTANLEPLRDYLDGLDYPVSKEDLVRRAQESGATTEVLQLLRSLPAEYFNSPAEVATSLAEMA